MSVKTKGQSFRDFIHQRIMDRLKEAEAWFIEKSKGRHFPFYSSFDIRDSNWKAACVDANVFPAGFNNICVEDQRRAASLMRAYLKSRFPKLRQVIILAEEHTKNLYYWDNVSVIQLLVEQAGFETMICVPGHRILSAQKIKTASGKELSIRLLREEIEKKRAKKTAEGVRKKAKDQTEDQIEDQTEKRTKDPTEEREKRGGGELLILSNNDFSIPYDLPSDIPCEPPPEMGWMKRKKQSFFKEYNLLAEEFASLLGIDPWHLTIATELFRPFDVESKENMSDLQSKAEAMLQSLRERQERVYPEGGEEPYLFLKNNSGTYGLGVMDIKNPEDLKHLSWKSRKKMKASKAGRGISEIIIQEGIPTALPIPEKQSAEPVIYMLGCETAGGFLRSHSTKDRRASLNSPGAVFRRFCMSDLEFRTPGLVMENVYSWLAKIGCLALSREMEKPIR